MKLNRLKMLHMILNQKAVQFVNNPTQELKDEIEAIKNEIEKLEE